MSWNDIPRLAESQLSQARMQMHHAAQILSIIARSYLGPHEEDAHANLGWVPELNALISRPLPGPEGVAFLALQFNQPGILLAEESFSTQIPLEGNSWNTLFNQVVDTLAERGFEKDKISLGQPYKDDLPDFETYENEFDVSNEEAIQVLGSYFGNTQALLAELLSNSPEASEIRCWPHHFDIASLLDLGEGKSIGVGTSPGDGSYALPYLYVNMWPYPDTDKVSLANLSYGKWNTSGWVGTILHADAFAGLDNQQEIIKSFIKESISAARELLQ